jgi:hypothetical protein
MPRFFGFRPFLALSLVLIAVSMMAASGDSDRFQIGHDIHVGPNDKAGDVSCINCTVYVRGQVSGDVMAVHGNVVAEQGANIGGDVLAIAGNARLENGAQVGGDLTAIAGSVRRDPQATVGGDVASVGNTGWAFLILLLPLAFLGGLIALIIWLFRRGRHPAPVPAYTLHRN